MKIAFGVFDWGLGHATRDIPLIEALIKRKHEVHIISTGRALNLLKSKFDNKCKFFDVPSLFVPYSKTRFFSIFFFLSIIRLLNSLMIARRISVGILKREKYDLVVSDCRYDLYDRLDNSFLINHQLRFKSFFGAQAILEKWLANRMNNYKFVIVPDFRNPNITGLLSHNLKYFNNKKIKYIGILSQIKKVNLKKDIDFFVSISGPEPQRTVLEEKILPMLKKLKGKIVVSLGKPEIKNIKLDDNISIYSFLNSEKQGDFMNRAKCIITRSGYTTIMEIVELDKKQALIIPTPGQTEQEYLADLYEEKGYFHHSSQYDLKLKKDIELSKKSKGFKCPWKTEESVKKFLKVIGL